MEDDEAPEAESETGTENAEVNVLSGVRMRFLCHFESGTYRIATLDDDNVELDDDLFDFDDLIDEVTQFDK